MDILKQSTQFLKESRTEMKKVSWPNRQETIRYTLIVIGTSIAFAIFLGLIDIGLHFLLEQFILR